MTVFLSCVKTSNDLKNHPFSQTKSRSQVSGSDIYSDFQRWSVLLWKIFFARLRGIQTLEGANKLLQGRFIDSLNNKFMKIPASMDDAHVALMEEQNLDDIMCWEYTRTVYNDWIIRFENQLLQIQKTSSIRIRPKQKITLKRHLNGKITLWSKGQKIPYCFTERQAKEEKKTAQPYSADKRSQNGRESKKKSPWSQFNPGWLKQTKEHLEAAST